MLASGMNEESIMNCLQSIAAAESIIKMDNELQLNILFGLLNRNRGGSKTDSVCGYVDPAPLPPTA